MLAGLLLRLGTPAQRVGFFLRQSVFIFLILLVIVVDRIAWLLFALQGHLLEEGLYLLVVVLPKVVLVALHLHVQLLHTALLLRCFGILLHGNTLFGLFRIDLIALR